jgi:hypothetical protein
LCLYVLPSPVSGLQSPVYSLRSTVSGLQSPVYGLQSLASYLLYTTFPHRAAGTWHSSISAR